MIREAVLGAREGTSAPSFSRFLVSTAVVMAFLQTLQQTQEVLAKEIMSFNQHPVNKKIISVNDLYDLQRSLNYTR